MTAYSQRFRLTNERAVVGRVVFLSRGQVGVVTEVGPPRQHMVDYYAKHPAWGDPPVTVTVAWGLKSEPSKANYFGETSWNVSDLGDYDLHLAYQAELQERLFERRRRLPGALPLND